MKKKKQKKTEKKKDIEDDLNSQQSFKMTFQKIINLINQML